VQIYLRPARVQGPGAENEIARAIADLNRFGEVDILIVGRGGGSLEDLWPFNEEVVARAIYGSRKPVISAVGHEVDYTIADYVADCRAPTPSAAAEIVVQERTALGKRILDDRQRLERSMNSLLDLHAGRLREMDPQRLYRRLEDRLDQTAQYLDERRRDLANSFDRIVRDGQDALRRLTAQVHALSPLAHLARGFALCQRHEDGTPVRRAAQLRPGDRVDLTFSEGGATAQIEEIRDGRADVL
jgi:exodeoxyribonuclease VII large subunit